MLGDDGAAQALLGPPVAPANPRDRGPSPGSRETDPQPGEDVPQGNLRRERDRDQEQGGRCERGARRAEPPPDRLRDRAAEDAAGVRLFTEELPPPEPERKERRDGEHEQGESRRLGRRAFDGAPAEHLPGPEEEDERQPPGGQSHQDVESGRKGGADSSDPVIRGGGLSPRRDREEVGVPGIVRQKGERRQEAGKDEKDPERFARDPAAPETSLSQS